MSQDITGATRPRIALMGEFSAGKSTLANLLLGQAASPVKVTATQLPPLWYRFGPSGTRRVDSSGAEQPVDVADLEAVSHHETQAVLVSLESDVLEFCDLIDMPGTSDPNLPQELWDRMLCHIDGVVWCTPATQAWRQSEAALWEGLPDRLRARSLLLVTRIDKIASDTDRTRILARVKRETDGLFRAVIPISLTEALAADEDAEALAACGAETFVASLVEIVEGIVPQAEGPAVFSPVKLHSASQAAGEKAPPVQPAGISPRRVVPRRIQRAAIPADASG